MRLLIIEDDKEAASYLVKGLSESGHAADHAADGHEGLRMAFSGAYDALIVDRMLPGMNGLAVIAALRAAGNDVPVLILSALGEVDDRVEGLQGGADDYLTKPFAYSELLARLDALVRRTHAEPKQTVLELADLRLDLLERTVSRAGKAIPLQPREFRLLETLLRHAGQVVTRTMLLEHVWDEHADPFTNTVRVTVGTLRRKLSDDSEIQLIETVIGSGYRLIDSAAATTGEVGVESD